MKKTGIFLLGMVAGVGGGAAVGVGAAPGDWLYDDDVVACATKQQSKCFLQCAKKVDDDMEVLRSSFNASDECESGYHVSVGGLKMASPGDLPIQGGSVEVVGIAK